MPRRGARKSTNGLQTDQERLQALGKERVSTTLKRFGTIRQTAVALMVSHTALRRYLDEEGLRDLSDPDLASRHKRLLQSKNAKGGRAGLAKWLDEHPGENLPTGSIKEIAKKTGCTIDQVKTYLYRVRKDLKADLARLPDLRKHGVILQLNSRTRIETRKLEWYRFVLNRKTFKVILFCGNKEGQEWQVPIPDPHKFVTDILNFINHKIPPSFSQQELSELLSTIASPAMNPPADNTQQPSGSSEPGTEDDQPNQVAASESKE